MNNSKLINRRRFVKLSTGVVAGIPLIISKIGLAQEELIELTEDDPTAQALAYKANAAEVDTEAYPNFVDGSLCSNCLMYLGLDGDVTGPCSLFPGKSVTTEGWCSVYAPRPS